MTTSEAACGLFIAVADQLPAFTATLVDELLDANERGVAVEILSDILVESDARISPATMAVFQKVVADMSMDQANVERLRPLVLAAGDAI